MVQLRKYKGNENFDYQIIDVVSKERVETLEESEELEELIVDSSEDITIESNSSDNGVERRKGGDQVEWDSDGSNGK